MYTVGIYLYDEPITKNMVFATKLILIAGVFFIIGYNIIPLGARKFKQKKYFIIRNTPNLYFILLVLLSVAISFFIYVVILKIGVQDYFFTSRANRSLIVRPYSHFMVFIDLLNFISVLSLFLFLKTHKSKYKKLFIISFSFAILHAVLTISRNNLVLIIVPTIFLLHYYNYIKAKTIVFIVLIGLFVAVVWKVLLFNLIIGDSFDISQILENIKFPREFVVWQEISQNILQSNFSLHGESYLNAIVSLFYPFHFADNLSLWYVKNYEPHTYEIGGGRGFSNVLEAYINFDIAGVIVFFFLFGILIYIFQRKSMSSIYFLLPYAFSLAFIHRIFRSDFMSLIKTWWWMYCLSFILLLALFKTLRVRNRV
jgi:oligosaccharide repeat unit polymerase